MTDAPPTPTDRGCVLNARHRHERYPNHHHHDAWCLPYDLWPRDRIAQDREAEAILGRTLRHGHLPARLLGLLLEDRVRDR